MEKNWKDSVFNFERDSALDPWYEALVYSVAEQIELDRQVRMSSNDTPVPNSPGIESQGKGRGKRTEDRATPIGGERAE